MSQAGCGEGGRAQGEKKKKVFQAAKGRVSAKALRQKGITPGSEELPRPEGTDQGRAVSGCSRDGPQRALLSGSCQFQQQFVARGRICFSGSLSQLGQLTLMWRQCTHHACKLHEQVGYLEAEPQLPARMHYHLQLCSATVGTFQVRTLWFLQQECQVSDASVPFTVLISSLCPHPAKDLAFHGRFSEATGSQLTVVTCDTEGSVS